MALIQIHHHEIVAVGPTTDHINAIILRDTTMEEINA